VSPIEGGQYHGGKLHNNIQTNQNKAQIAKAVKPIGFAPPATWLVKKHQINEKEAAVIAHLEHHQHPVLNDPAWSAWSKMIGNDPNPLFAFYKLDRESTPKAMSQERLTKPIGIPVKAPKTRNLPSVDIRTPPPQKALSAPAREDGSHDDNNIIRVRDSDLDPASYDPYTGEFYGLPPAKLSARQQADRWVSDALGKST
jgi:hypothetical protein